MISRPARGFGRDRYDLARAALWYGRHGARVLPLVPAASTRPGAGKAPLTAHGVHDASSDPDVIAAWWRRWPRASIGAVVPDSAVVVDIDPRNGGARTLARLQTRHGVLPVTLTVWSGRGDGGRHLYWRRPTGDLHGAGLGEGLDLKTSAGYCVVPPSPHPVTGAPYRWEWHQVAEPPVWLTDLLTGPMRPTSRPAPRNGLRHKSSIIEAFNGAVSWHDVLTTHGWRRVRGDGESPGSGWSHPVATSACSATVGADGRLYVYSTSTPLTPTEPGAPRGHSRFDVWVALTHDGDRTAAIARLRTTGGLS